MLDFSWSNILHSNAFNFTIMIIFFAVLIKHLKVPEALEMDRASIQESVEISDSLSENAENEFKKVKKSIENLPKELDEILVNAEITAKAFEVKSKEEIDKLVSSIKLNAEKQVSTEEKQIQSTLMKNISKSSVEIAHGQVKKAFESNKELHKKVMNDFIESLDKLEV